MELNKFAPNLVVANFWRLFLIFDKEKVCLCFNKLGKVEK